jgi:soluble lytic murein transglycosylase-like protein
MLGYRILIALTFAAVMAAVTVGTAAAYTVQAGDSLCAISNRTGVPVSKIAADNHIANPDQIYVGQQLSIQAGPQDPAPVATTAQPGATYVVRRGDSLWKIARQTAVSMAQIVTLNNISTTAALQVGQRLLLAPLAPPPAPSTSAPAVRGEAARRLLVAAAHEFGVNPAFVLAVSLWESGYNQGVVSSTGAVGLMQVEPATAAWAGPALLGGAVDITDARSNARLGTALLAHYLQVFNDDPKLTLAAYYQGAAVTQSKGILPESRGYVDGVWALRNRIAGS